MTSRIWRTKFAFIIVAVLAVAAVGISQARLVSGVFKSNTQLDADATESIGTSGNSGNLSYGYTIKTPPAPADFGPDLSLSYSSGGRNGALGLGWSLPVPAITRRTAEGGLDYAGEDFEFEGWSESGRLVRVGTNTTYPDADEYRLEFENGLALRFFLSAAPDSVSLIWRLLDKDQTMTYFGNSTSSQISDGLSGSDRRIYKWNISLAADIFGNEIAYRYTAQDHNSHETSYLKEIAYGQATIGFTYSGDPGDLVRRDAQTSYYSSFPLKTSRYLKSIQSSIGGLSSYHYALDYRINEITDNLLLVSIKRIGRNGEELPATEFTYSGEEIEAIPFNPAPLSGAQNRPFTPKVLEDVSDDLAYTVGGPLQTGTGLIEPWFTADFNGDGCTDVLHLVNNTTVRVWLGRPDGSFDVQPAWNTVADMSGSFSDPFDGNNNIYRYLLQFGDFNGDNATDVFLIYDNHVADIWLANFDGDGNFNNFERKAVVVPRLAKLPYSEQTFSFEMPDDARSGDGWHVRYNFKIGDFNGDGLDDLLGFYPQDQPSNSFYGGTGDYFILYSEGDGYFEKQEFHVQITGAIDYDFGMPVMMNTQDYDNCLNPAGDGRADYGEYPIDVNSDGLVDIVHVKCREAVTVFLNQGPDVAGAYHTTFRKMPIDTEDNFHLWGSLGSAPDDFRLAAGDFNGDGVLDLVHELYPGTLEQEYYVLFGSNDWRADETGQAVESQYLGGDEEVFWTGFSDFENEPQPFSGSADVIMNIPSSFCTVQELNGDGRADFINPSFYHLDWESTNGTYPLIRPDLYQFVGNGDGTFDHTHPMNGPMWFSEVKVDIEFPPYYIPSPLWHIFRQAQCYYIAMHQSVPEECINSPYLITPSGEFSGMLENDAVRIADFNGDRMADFLNLDAGRLINYNTQMQNVSPDLLVRVERGGHLAAEVDYASSATMANSRMGFAKPVPNAIREYDGVGGEKVKYLEYNEGRYDNVRHEFAGFAFVEESDEFGTRIATRYHLDAALRGRAKDTATIISSGDTASVRTQYWNAVPAGVSVFAALDSVVTVTHTLGEGENYDHIQRLEFEYAPEHFGVTLMRTSGSGMEDGVYWVGGGEEASELVTTYTKVLDWRWVKVSETTRGNITSISRKNEFYYHPWTGVLIQAQYGAGGANAYSKTFTFTAEGNLQNLTSSDGTSVEFEYDGTKTMVVRQEQKCSPGMSLVDSMAVDVGLGVVVDGWSPNGELTHNEYDGFGRPTATTTYPGTPSARGTIQSGYGADTRWTYHDGELPLRVVIETRQSAQSSADDYSTKVELYDLNGGLVQTATSATPDEAGLDRYAILRTVSDYSNRRTSVYGPFYAASTALVGEAAIPDSSRMTESHFDYLGRSVRDVRRHRQYGEVETTYDFTARSVEVTDPVDRSVLYIWNAAGRIVYQVGLMAGTSGYSRMIYQYNTAGDLTSAINYHTGESFLREYDRIGGLTKETDSDVGTRDFLRWSNGELKRVTEQDGETRLYYRDWLLRKMQVSYSRTGANDVFGYDDENVDNAIGKMTRSAGPGYTWSALDYDMYGNCAADSVWVSGSLPFVARYEHRPGGELSEITYPGGGEAQYTYYPKTELLESATLNYAGTELRSEFRDLVPSGKAKTTEYFANGSEVPFLRLNRDIGWADGMLYRIIAIATPDAEPDTVLDVRYSYLEDGNLGFSADRTNPAAPARITRYEYDFASRLTREYDNGATTPNREVTYSADRPRFETLRSASRTLSYSYDWSHPHRPQALSVGASTYNLTYDSRGNVATDVHLENFITPTVRHLTYDARGQVSRIDVDVPIGLPEIFEDCLYSPEGRLVRQSDSFGRSIIRPYSFYEVNSDNVIRYLEADGISVGYINTSATQNTIAVFVHDRRGDIRAVVDGNGVAISEFEYGAWGKTTAIGASEISGRRFGGKIYDDLAHFTDFGARKYESSYGLFLAPDAFTPNAFDYIDLNRYAYARFNPMRNTDPNGHFIETLWDITQVSMGAVSLWNNVKEGSVGAAIIDGAGMVLDVGAAVLPGVPAGASTAIKAARAGDYVASFVRWGDDLVDTAKVGVRELGERASGRASQALGAVRGVFRRGGDDAVEIATERSAPSAAREGATTVYRSVNEAGQVQYVGITNKLARRAAEHLRERGMRIEEVLVDLSRSDARAVEQALIEIHKLGKDGGTLLNRINSIAPTNPSYSQQLQRGYELLQTIGYP